MSNSKPKLLYYNAPLLKNMKTINGANMPSDK